MLQVQGRCPHRRRHLAPMQFAFAGLGWEAGTIMLLMGIATTCKSGCFATWREGVACDPVLASHPVLPPHPTAGYCSLLLSELHEMNGVRYVRYRDVGRAIYGNKLAYAIVAFQPIASLANNIPLGIVAGRGGRGAGV